MEMHYHSPEYPVGHRSNFIITLSLVECLVGFNYVVSINNIPVFTDNQKNRGKRMCQAGEKDYGA